MDFLSACSDTFGVLWYNHMPSSVTLRDYIKMSRRTRPSTATSTCPLVNHPMTSGNVVRADHERDGSIRPGRIMEFPRRICGGVRRVVVTEEQRYGPRRLRVNDDDDMPLLKKLGNLGWRV